MSSPTSLDIYVKAVYLPTGALLKYREFVEYCGDIKMLEAINNDKFYVIGYRRGFKHPVKDIEVDKVVSLSSYSRIFSYGDKYLKVQSGCRIINLLRHMAFNKKFFNIPYPPDPFESIGGFITQKLYIPSGSPNYHVFNTERGYKEYRDGFGNRDILLDIHYIDLKKLHDYRPVILSTFLSEKELEMVLTRYDWGDSDLSVLRYSSGFKLVAILWRRSYLRELIERLTKIISRNRIDLLGLHNLKLENLPIIDRRLLYGSRGFHVGLFKYIDDLVLKNTMYFNLHSNVAITTRKSSLSDVYWGVELS